MASVLRRLVQRSRRLNETLFSYKSLFVFNHNQHPFATSNWNDDLLKEITSRLSDLRNIGSNNPQIDLLLQEIRNINPSKATDTLNNEASFFLFQYYVSQHINDDIMQKKQCNDMDIGYKLLQHVIDHSIDNIEKKLSLHLKTQYAMYLYDVDSLNKSFNELMQCELTDEQIGSLCINLCLYGYWDKLSDIVDLAKQQNIEYSLQFDGDHWSSELKKAFNVNHLCKQYGLNEEKKYKKWQYGKKYKVYKIFQRLKSIECDSEDTKNEILKQFYSMDNMSDDKDPYEMWMEWYPDNYNIVKNVQIYEMNGLTIEKRLLAGPCFDDDKIVVTGSNTVNQQDDIATIEGELLYLERDINDTNMWRGYYRVEYDRYQKNDILNWAYIDNSATITYHFQLILQ